MCHIVGGEGMAVESHSAAVGSRDVVDDTYESGLAGAVGAEQTVDAALGDTDTHVIEGRMVGKPFSDVFRFYDVHTEKVDYDLSGKSGTISKTQETS